MRAIVEKYLEKKDPKLYAEMTSEEQRFVDRQKPKSKPKGKKLVEVFADEEKKGKKE